ncbi:MAG TPA: SpoIID/LytB domain-containing protein [Elusimicrobiales bacterium]|nr:SpoIID/LytB domain-containing protein [Elusimicrobiales bacterium]
MKIFFKSLLFLILSQSLYSADGISKSVEVRILIENNSEKISLKTYGKVYLTEEKTGEKYLLVEESNYDIKAEGSDFVYVSLQKLYSPVLLENSNPNSHMIINGKKYRGKFKIKNSEGKIQIIEFVDIERYLWGVLGPEMGTSWPMEALKAQAVASRTYTLASLNRNADYDMTNSTKHQVYTGFENISPQIISAVNETRGEVLTYKDNIFYAYYHANSGGQTTTPSGVWNGDIIPPLKGVKDPYYKNSKHAGWSIYVSNSDILNFISSSGHSALKIKDMKIYSKDRSGRAVKLLFKTDKGNIKLEAKDFRNHVGNFDMKSTLITNIIKMKNGFKITGKGWGHGVGLCQDGAREMADRGADYKKILNFYYPGSKIKDIEDVYYDRR